MEARFLHRDVLQPIDFLHINEPQNRTDSALGDQVIGFATRQPWNRHSRGLVHLPDLLFKGHLLEKSLSFLVSLGCAHLPGLSRQVSCISKKSAEQNEQFHWPEISHGRIGPSAETQKHIALG